MGRRKAALQNAIRKFNTYCETLRVLAPPDCSIPIPHLIPLELSDLKDNTDLMEDVWIEPSQVPLPPWLDSANVRKGINAMLKIQRTEEELQRIGWEADNLLRWFSDEAVAMQVALYIPESTLFFL